jgi:hypothetical protein
MTTLSKPELETLVLTMMHNQPACGSLKKIAIRTEPTGKWSIVPADPTATFSPEVSKAARKVEHNLRKSYDVVSDP